jgi:hypothetical protein
MCNFCALAELYTVGNPVNGVFRQTDLTQSEIQATADLRSNSNFEFENSAPFCLGVRNTKIGEKMGNFGK